MKKTMIVVSGSKSFFNLPMMVNTMDYIIKGLKDVEVTIREGGSKGTGKLAKEYAEHRSIKLDEVTVDWDNLNVYPCIVKTRHDGSRYNAMAGLICNEMMISKEDVGLVVMFCVNGSSEIRDAKKHAISYKRNYLFINVNSKEIEMAIKGKLFKKGSYESFIEGDYNEWLELVLKSI